MIDGTEVHGKPVPGDIGAGEAREAKGLQAADTVQAGQRVDPAQEGLTGVRLGHQGETAQ
ncbi:hypothetical protein [Streptomyces sp. NPDC046985]|uniref:hypothetical protein n=1 Tax=Streptomyces sp. NPDC046985 TaxID=3155377 RepID=UPI0034097977